MPDATTLDSIRTGTPDATNGIKVPSILAREDSTLEIPVGVSLSDRIPNGPTAHRSSTGTADSATDMSSAGFGSAGTEHTNNRGALVVWLEFATAGATCRVKPVYYDAAATPAPMALGPALNFAATSKRLSASGNYMSEAQIIETYGFAKFKMYIEAISAGNVVVHAVPI